MRASVLTILGGMLLIALLVPVAQFGSVAMLNSDMETASPSGWAVGLLTSLVLAAAAFRLIARRGGVPRRGLVILYVMLTIAVPMMNLGFVRPLVLSLRAVQQHFVALAVNTYRTAYEAQSPSWFPVVPTIEGLAWNKANRLLTVLRDDAVLADRDRARRDLLLLLHRAGAPGPNDAALRDQATGLVRRLGVDELEALGDAAGRDERAAAGARVVGLDGLIRDALADLRPASAAAARRLTEGLAGVDEREADCVPQVLEHVNRNARLRVEQDRARLSDADRRDLDERAERLSGRFGDLRTNVTALAAADWTQVRSVLAAGYRRAWAGLPESRLAAIRTSFLYRSSAQERAALCAQDGRNGTPNENLVGFGGGLLGPTGHRELANEPVGEQLSAVSRSLPWSLWLRPLAMWAALCLTLFLFLMCVAEWLRRKWVDRENLAFPLVEVADHLIRHDCALESADDVRSPQPRGRRFSPVLWAGIAVGALLITVEALGHYHVASDTRLMAFDISKQVFTTGPLKELDHIVFVLSPILVGILFLVSLEISFSVWVLFVIYSLAFFLAKQANSEIKDSVFTGWAGGRFYPFAMEQLLGAAVCFTAILLIKARTRKTESALGGLADSYIPYRTTTVGLIVLPMVVLALLWNLGVTNVPFVLLVGLLVMALAIAAARLRAETGLYTQHVTYEFTKFPMVFGLTGWTGAKVYTLFVSLAVLPVTLLFRTLGQQLENLELARRNRVSYRTVAVASLAAFITAVAVGLVSFLVLCYWRGSTVYAGSQTPNFEGIMHYPLWVSHFLGEKGLDQMRQPHLIRVWFVLLGAGVFGLLTLLRSRVTSFPLHPVGYLLILSSIYFEWVSPYYKGDPTLSAGDGSWLWGSALVAWLIKKLIVKYGGMNSYKRAKPFFIGLIVGSLACLFVVNLVHTSALMAAARPDCTPGAFLKTFLAVPAYTPRVY